jgi:transposase InsO family protein
VSRKRVERLMREEGLSARTRRRFRGSTTDSAHTRPIAENVLDRQFSVAAQAGGNRVWVGDITYLPTGAGWLYRAVMLDLKSRRVVGYALGDSLETDLPKQALQRALWRRRPAAGLVHHSDRGGTVHVGGVPGGAGRARDSGEHEPSGELLVQRGGGEFATLEWELIERSRWHTHVQAEREVSE